MAENVSGAGDYAFTWDDPRFQESLMKVEFDFIVSIFKGPIKAVSDLAKDALEDDGDDD